MRRMLLIIGAAGLLTGAVSSFFSPQTAMRAYLFAWLCALAIALGSMAILMLGHLTGGAWSLSTRRPAEATAMTLPLLALLFVPIAIGMRDVFPWADPRLVAEHAILRHRQLLFNRSFFLVRSAVYFVAWIGIAWQLHRLSLEHDRTGDEGLLIRMQRLSAIGLVLYFITMSLAAVDWIASREIEWYSSTFGLLVIVGQGVAAVAFLILICAWSSDRRPELAHDLGNLLLTVVVLWSYIAFAQFLVIWIGNSQEDVTWYFHRQQGVWRWIGVSLILLHFAVPLGLLLFQTVKRRFEALSKVAAIVLFMQVIHVLWMLAPSSTNDHAGSMNWVDPIALIGVGGIWMACFGWLLSRRPIVPDEMSASIEPLSYGKHGEQSAA